MKPLPHLTFSLPCLLLLLTGSGLLAACKTETVGKNRIYSSSVKDSFEVWISAPTPDTGRRYNVVYYCDANLKSGKKLRELLLRKEHATVAEKTIFVGVGHIGDYHELRRRDFILPEIKNGDTLPQSADYGGIENFHRFLQEELVPKINAEYPTHPDSNTIVGHSLGGLFAFYCLFKNDNLFRHHYALSPSLWIDDYGIYRFNRLQPTDTAVRTLYFSAGGLELLNRIKAGADEMDGFLRKQRYPKLSFRYEVHSGEGHNSGVEKSLEYMLKEI